jgi:hypothetical protein
MGKMPMPHQAIASSVMRSRSHAGFLHGSFMGASWSIHDHGLL